LVGRMTRREPFEERLEQLADNLHY
jgi:hypothetical protein